MTSRRDETDRKAVLRRRARFVAAALAGAGVGVTPTLALGRDEGEETSPPAGDPNEQSPRICLSDIDISGEEQEPCGESPGEPRCEEPVPRVRMSEVPPQVCLSVLPPSADRDHRHDGFYLRVGPVGGVLALSLEEGAGSASPSGGAAGGLLVVGMTLADGVVVGLGIDAMIAPAPDDGAFRSLALWQLGPWIDVYPDPRRGWHAALSLAPTIVSAESKDGVRSGVGFGGSLWLGYDAWIAPSWSLGLAGGGLLGFASDTRADTSVALRARALTLSASLLWH